MKRVIFSLFIIYLLSLVVVLKADAASPSPDPVKDKVEQEINQLKDRIASRVAQLNLVEKRGIVGVVTDITGTQITVSDIKGDTRFVDVDELTKFIGGPNAPESFGLSDIKKDQNLSIVGLYNKQSGRILARSIAVITIPLIEHGYVATIDKDNFVVNVATDDNKQLAVSVGTSTRTLSFDLDKKDLVKSGFSKIVEGESIFIVGALNKEDKSKADADTLIIFPNIVKSPSIEISPSVTPSTGSGKKLTPILK